MNSKTQYILVVFYILPTCLFMISTEPKVIGAVFFAYTMGAIAFYASRYKDWFNSVF